MSPLARRIGRRGSCLLFFAVLDLFYALSLFQPVAEARRSASVLFIASILPLWAWGTLWLTVGILCIIGAFTRRDRWAFAAAVAIKTLWGGLTLLAWIAGFLERGWLSAVIWLAMAGWVLIISSWPEPPEVVRK